MTEGVHAFGTLLKLGDGENPEYFTPISEITMVNLPPLSRDEIEMTSHDSTDKYKEFIAGLKDAGELPFEYNLVQGAANQSVLLSLFESGEMRTWQLQLPTPTAIVIQFRAFVKSWGGESPIDDKIKGSAALRLSGKPTVSNL